LVKSNIYCKYVISIAITFPLHSDDIPVISVILFPTYIYIYTYYIYSLKNGAFLLLLKKTVSPTAKTSPALHHAQHLWTGQIQDLDDHLGSMMNCESTWDPPVVTLYDVLKLHENPLPPQKTIVYVYSNKPH
jgi:hypothetical protein